MGYAVTYCLLVHFHKSLLGYFTGTAISNVAELVLVFCFEYDHTRALVSNDFVEPTRLRLEGLAQKVEAHTDRSSFLELADVPAIG